MALVPRRPTSSWGRAFEGAFEAAISVVLGMIGGYYADRWLGTNYLVILGVVVGAIAGFRKLLQISVVEPQANEPGGPAPADEEDAADGEENRPPRS